PFALRIAGDRRVEEWVVRDHHHAIGGDADVKLQCADTDAQCALECGQGVLRRMTARAAVPLQVKRGGGQGKATDQGNEKLVSIHVVAARKGTAEKPEY